MDSNQGVVLQLLERRTPTNSSDVTAPTADATPFSLPAGVDKKDSKTQVAKKTAAQRSGNKHDKAKAKKGKKPTLAEDSSSSKSEEDQTTSTTSDESNDDSESEYGIVVEKKRVSKKRQAAQKPGKPAKLVKRVKNRDKPNTSSSGSDTEDSEADTEDESASDDPRPRRKRTSKKNVLTQEQQYQQVQLQLQQMQQQQQLQQLQQMQQMQRQTAGLSLGNTGGANDAALGTGSLGSGNQGSWHSNPTLANDGSLAQQANVTADRYAKLRRLAYDKTAHLGHRLLARQNLNRHNLRLTDELEDELDEDRPLGRDGEGSGKLSQLLEFKRVDQVWDSTIHNYKLQETAENASNSKYNKYLFHVRRTFDWDGKYKATVIDIKSKQLREALQDVLGNIKGVSLVEDTPKLDPNMLFLYLEDLREHMINLKDLEPDAKTKKERKKVQKWICEKRRHLRVLIKYLDKDYKQIKKSLYPLLENGLITFDLSWALWKPNTLAYTTTYGSHDEPRVFKVDLAEKQRSPFRGEFYYVEGKFFEYDGKQFGHGTIAEEISEFRGARKITSLGCYPLKYHKNEAKLRKDLVDRGKKFVDLAGAHYKSHQGIAYYKKKKAVIKVNINGRIMVDPSTHRRNNPNYPVSLLRPKDHDLVSDKGDDEEDGGCDHESENGGGGGRDAVFDDDEDQGQYVTKLVCDKAGDVCAVRIPKDEIDADENREKLDKIDHETATTDKDTQEGGGEKARAREFAEEDYLIASPVVLGFAFGEKLWLELSVSGVKEISWNDQAYESLVLEPKTKDIVKALVESHKYHAAESIDDVIQGKGKGLVFVLHGPPGTGKTLTAEGISELLKCPLYNVSAGDLGTDSRLLEGELQKVLDICHAWGAILLLDEADVFLEKRNMNDIHRNALVSIFLRQLEYFQGILFLTTNRVETFDEAFQSRIHIALRYDELDTKAKKKIFQMFVERVRVIEKNNVMPFTEEDYNTLARHSLNGRQIKNTVRTAQALAVNRGEALSMAHITQFLDVQRSFERDLKGGNGYTDAMRSYF
ncbi:hypothetical protein BJ170DRAFT_595068 [Xylariales sp. AK1849]|nr:hypothetical protein BJ170DRAFT_595068 [Xylariales sp. AK1849]